nr:hypothetical protein GZ27G5_2 [uncultured archaeon GZfos27G5]
MGRGTSDKSDLATTTPSTVIRSRFKSTVLTFPSLPLSSPRTTVTVSPLLTGAFLFAYLPCRSSERGALMNLCLTCKGALYLAFLCFLGCLDFISFQLLNYLFKYKRMRDLRGLMREYDIVVVAAGPAGMYGSEICSKGRVLLR